MNKNKLNVTLIDLVDKLAGQLPDELFKSNAPWGTTFREICGQLKQFRKDTEATAITASTITTRDYHVGESNYSAKVIQPWDVWKEYGLNPWDADICKRTIRTKAVPGLTPMESRIQDYEKIKHICDERIDQINNGDPYYKNFKVPKWVK